MLVVRAENSFVVSKKLKVFPGVHTPLLNDLVFACFHRLSCANLTNGYEIVHNVYQNQNWTPEKNLLAIRYNISVYYHKSNLFWYICFFFLDRTSMLQHRLINLYYFIFHLHLWSQHQLFPIPTK